MDVISGQHLCLEYGPKMAAIDRRILKQKPAEDMYDISLGSSKVTNQMASGRCWIFAGTNLLRIAYAQKMNMQNMELSNSFLFYHDKMERAEYCFKKMTGALKMDDIERKKFLCEPLQGDGGFFEYFQNLVEKYGLVPAKVMPETHCSQHSSELNEILNFVLKSYIPRMNDIRVKQSGREALWGEMKVVLKKILDKTLGELPGNFTFEWKTKTPNNNTPMTQSALVAQTLFKKKNIKKNHFSGNAKQFYNKFLSECQIEKKFVTLVNDDRFDYGKTVRYPRTNVAEKQHTDVYNVSLEEMKEAVIKSVCEMGIPVYLGCDVEKQSSWKYGIMDAKLFDYSALFGFQIENLDRKTKVENRIGSSTHAMLITGAHFDSEGKIDGWLIENSWGSTKDSTPNGFFHMNFNWWDDNVWTVSVPRSCVKTVFDQNNVELVAVDDPFFE